MPPHPLNACLNHILEQALRNIVLANSSADFSQIRIATDHAQYVANILNDYLLYGVRRDLMNPCSKRIPNRLGGTMKRNHWKSIGHEWKYRGNSLMARLNIIGLVKTMTPV